MPEDEAMPVPDERTQEDGGRQPDGGSIRLPLRLGGDLCHPAARRTVRNKLLVLVPIYNDWAAAGLLLPRLDRVLAAADLTADVLLIDDGSTASIPAHWLGNDWRALDYIEVLSLRRNVGHQRAIAIALAYVERHRSPDAVVVMDGDGEDAPEDVPRLLACLDENERRLAPYDERLLRWSSRSAPGEPRA